MAGDRQDEIAVLVQWVARRLGAGRSREDLPQDLEHDGVALDEARTFVLMRCSRTAWRYSAHHTLVPDHVSLASTS